MTNLSETPMPEQNPAKPPMSLRAKRYWGSWIATVIIALVIGAALRPHASRIGAANGETGQGSLGDVLNTHLDPKLGVMIALLWGIGVPLVSIFGLRNADEQEIHANLWAGLVGSYAVLIGIPVWHLLWMANLAPPVDIWAIFLMVAVLNIITWAWLKFRH
jgi:hypothetical protein